jgi:hypothetical protein
MKLKLGLMGVTALAASALLGFSFALQPTVADADLPPHGHMLVLQPEFDPALGEHGGVTGWHRCIDLAGGRHVPLHAHHDTVHTGRAGEALFDAGHAVVPTAPLTPWENCAELEAALPIIFD